MILGAHRASADLCSLEPGTHLCALDTDADRLDRVAATFVGQGLAAGDQLLYVASEEQVEGLVGVLPDHLDPRLDLRLALDTGQLVTSTFESTYGSARPDDLLGIAEGFRGAARQAHERGFRALRVAARMDRLVDLLGSIDQVVAWERASTELQRDTGVSSVCLYDAGLLAEGERARIAREHDGLAPDVDVIPHHRLVPEP